jgi:flagellar M-ring protein FliF
MTSGQLEYQRALEKDLESRIVGILEPVVGKNRVKAKVAAAVDFTKVEKTEERFDPDSQVIRSEQRATEKALSGSTGGVPGVASNLPAKTAPATGGSQGQSEKKNETVNYEISRITSRSINALGEVKRISVVALVDGVYAAAEAGKDAKEAKEKKYSPRAEEELKKFEDMVKNAVGFTAARGDEVRVVNMQFEGAAPEDLAEAKRDFLPIILTVGKYLVPIVVVALLFILVIKPLLNVLATPSAPPARAGLALPQSVAEIERALEIGDTSARDRLIDWAKKNPKDAADLVKSWIAER